MDLFSSFKAHLQQTSLLQSGDRLVVGVSGGIDSVVLLDLLGRLLPAFDLKITVAHMNHGLRGRESARDASFVKKETERRGLAFQLKTLSSKALKGSNRQARARKLRYDFFAQAARRAKAFKILTAHQADDQVETFLMRLIRGAGSEGLRGMRDERSFQNFSLIRPLLPFTRESILQYAKQRRLAWREDVSNEKEDYLRNRVRGRMVSSIREMNPKGLEAISQALRIFGEEEDWIEGQIQEKAKGRLLSRKGKILLPLSWLQAQKRPLRFRLYRMALQKALGDLQGIGRRHLDMIEGMVIKGNETARLSLPKGFGARVTRKQWLVEKGSPTSRRGKRGFFY